MKPLESRIVLVTGKGGTGKSALACALAYAYARRGERTLLVEFDADAAARRFFAVPGVGFVPLETAPGVWAVAVDPMEALEEYVAQFVPIRRVARAIIDNPVLRFFFRAAPSVFELASIHKLWSLAEERDAGTPRYERIVVDLPATGHAYTFLNTPRALTELDMGPLTARLRRYAELLFSPRTELVIATLPEELPVNETAELYARLHAWGDLRVTAVVANQVETAAFNPAEAAMLDTLAAAWPAYAATAADSAAAAAVAAARIEAARAERSHGALAALRARVPVPVLELPKLQGTGVDRAGLKRLGDTLLAAAARVEVRAGT